MASPTGTVGLLRYSFSRKAVLKTSPFSLAAKQHGACEHWGLMRAEELRAVQTPLKERYRANPEAAVVTLSATGQLGEGINCSVRTGSALAAAGLHPASGGDGTLLCSGDMLLEALVACAGVTLCAVCTSLEIPLEGGTVSAEGDLDFRGTLGVSKEAPVGFRAIRLHFDLVSAASSADLDTALRLTERYCVVLQTIQRPPETTVSYRQLGSET